MIPLRKPSKDPTKPTNYRAVSVTSNVCMIVERKVKEQLAYFAEKTRIVSRCLSGFRTEPLDPIVCLNEIRKALINKESAVLLSSPLRERTKIW